MTDVKLLLLHSDSGNHLTVCVCVCVRASEKYIE